MNEPPRQVFRPVSMAQWRNIEFVLFGEEEGGALNAGDGEIDPESG